MTKNEPTGDYGRENLETDFWMHHEYKDLKEFTSFLESEICADWLLDYLQGNNPEFSDRKEFCEIFGIGESTLSGWLKGDRIPKMAKVVIGLLKSRQLDREQLKEREVQIKNLKSRDRIVQDGDRYLIVAFPDDQKFGHIAARDIPDLPTAEKFNLRYGFVDLLEEIHANSGFWEGDVEDPYLEQLKDQIKEALTAEAGITSTKRPLASGNLPSAEPVDRSPAKRIGR